MPDSRKEREEREEKARRKHEREMKRKAKIEERKREEEEKKMQLNIAKEERKILIAQRKLESIRLLTELFDKVKVRWELNVTDILLKSCMFLVTGYWRNLHM